ncbi:MAG: hypothetical protein ACNA8L_05705 [Luteolibacter sp.]
MPAARQWILVIANVIIAAAVAVYVFGGGSSKPTSTAGSQAVEVNLEPLLKPVESLEEALDRFAITLQRFNTTIVQYDFLQKDIERLNGLDQAVAMRLNQEQMNKVQLGDEAGEQIDELIGQIQQFQEQVQKELEQRRQMMMQLIAGLEQNLAASNLDENAVREVLGDTPVPANPNLDMSLPPSIPADE